MTKFLGTLTVALMLALSVAGCSKKQKVTNDVSDTQTSSEHDSMWSSSSDSHSASGTDSDTLPNLNADSTATTPTDSNTALNTDNGSESPGESDSHAITDTSEETTTQSDTGSESTADTDSASAVDCSEEFAPCTLDSQCCDGVCNQLLGMCDLPDCYGQPDFTPCEVVTTPDRSFDICIDSICQSPGCGTVECVTPGPHFRLADTNQRTCFDTSSALASCPDSGYFAGQDAQYGWDASHASADRYTRILSTSGEPVVQDNSTGIFWQGCPAGLSGNSCEAGEVSKRVCSEVDCQDAFIPNEYAWEDAVAYCDQLDWGGYTDWRLPDIFELHSIVDLSYTQPCLDPAAFPGIIWDRYSERWLMSTSTYVYSESTAMALSLYNGFIDNHPKSFERNVLCVRGDVLAVPRFLAIEDVETEPVVRDFVTGLDWQGCAAGQLGSTCTGNGVSAAEKYTWQGALAYCDELEWGERNDWRLPNQKELYSIVDFRFDNPMVLTSAFHNTPSSVAIWTASTDVTFPETASGIDFQGATVKPYVKTESLYVRCVSDITE
ncbi:MAG: DUF1566 domain-containing protein [Deltaproteobacteria bacterium]|nr:DUF1566 domain-containing protein [Deltaproteobacteria bacterium]